MKRPNYVKLKNGKWWHLINSFTSGKKYYWISCDEMFHVASETRSTKPPHAQICPKCRERMGIKV